MEPLLRVEGLHVRYKTREGALPALRDISFEVEAGEIVGVVGESGCGKSTVASTVMRLLPPNAEIVAGQLLFKGQDIRHYTPERMRRLWGKEMSMVFQDPMTSLNPVFTIEDQLMAALLAQSGRNERGRSQLRERMLRMLERVGISDAARRIKEYPHQFSGGMRQRIMIARALLSNPSLLIADEPTSALDVTLEAQINDLIRDLRDELGTAILYITHDLSIVAHLCDRVIVMYAGNVIESGDVHDVFARPLHPYTRALLRANPSQLTRSARLETIPGRVPSLRSLPPGCKFSPRCEHAREICRAAEPEYSRRGRQTVLCHMFRPDWQGGPADVPAADRAAVHIAARGERRPEADDVVVSAEGLQVRFRDRIGLLGQLLGQRGGTVRAVDGVDITLRCGEILAVVGESGSGKTTLGRAMLRLTDPTAGRIVLEGQEITHLSQSEIRPARARFQMIFQDPISSLNPRLKVSSLLLEPFAIHGVRVADRKAKVAELLDMVGLSAEQADKYPHQLSGGQARRVGIARALALSPDILVADEPTAGLDVSVAAGILNLLKDLRDRLNLTYVIITHNLNVISYIADRVAVMYLGKVVELADTVELLAHPRHPYTQALLSAISIPDPSLRDKHRRIVLAGEIPSPRNPPRGCPFHPRCRYVEEGCTSDIPLLRPVAGETHFSACHFPERVKTG